MVPFSGPEGEDSYLWILGTTTQPIIHMMCPLVCRFFHRTSCFQWRGSGCHSFLSVCIGWCPMAETNGMKFFQGLPWIISEAFSDHDPSAECPLVPSPRQILFMCKYTVPLSPSLNTAHPAWNVAHGRVLYFKYIFGLGKEWVFLEALKVCMSPRVSLFNFRKQVMGKAGDIAWDSGTVTLNQTLSVPAPDIGLHRSSWHRSWECWGRVYNSVPYRTAGGLWD